MSDLSLSLSVLIASWLTSVTRKTNPASEVRDEGEQKTYPFSVPTFTTYDMHN